MILECCSQERSYLRFYGHMGQRLCLLGQAWVAVFDEAFQQQVTAYKVINILNCFLMGSSVECFSFVQCLMLCFYSLSLSLQYATVHRLETNKLRNTARFFAQLFYSDSLPWTALSCVHLNEDETTSSSRIFVKILFQELAEFMGLVRLNERLRDP